MGQRHSPDKTANFDSKPKLDVSNHSRSDKTTNLNHSKPTSHVSNHSRSDKTVNLNKSEKTDWFEVGLEPTYINIVSMQPEEWDKLESLCDVTIKPIDLSKKYSRCNYIPTDNDCPDEFRCSRDWNYVQNGYKCKIVEGKHLCKDYYTHFGGEENFTFYDDDLWKISQLMSKNPESSATLATLALHSHKKG
jgi:hypothetical protein